MPHLRLDAFIPCCTASCALLRPLTSSTRSHYKWFMLALDSQSLAPQTVLSCKLSLIGPKCAKMACIYGSRGDSDQEPSAMAPH